MLEPGKLRHLMVLEDKSITPDGLGGHTITWQETARIWVSVETLNGRQIRKANQEKNLITHRVTARHNASIKPGLRFRFDNRILDIHSVIDPDNRRAQMLILCEESVSE